MMNRCGRGIGVAAGLLVGTLAVTGTRAESTGENAVLIVDPTSPISMYVGNYYRAMRDIPATNVLYMNPAAVNYATFAEANLDALFGGLANAAIDDHIDYVVVMPGGSFFIPASGYVNDSCSPVNRFAVASAYTMAFLKDDILAGGVPVSLPNRFYTSSNLDPVAFDSGTTYFGGNPSDDANARRYFIGAMLGYSGERGNTAEEIIDLIDRSVMADGTEPDGTFYFMDNDADPARNVRANQYNSAASNIIARGGNAEVLDGIIPTGRHDCLGIMTGAANPAIDAGDFTIWAGAFADHLTSWAGMFDNAAQTKMSRWVVKGASGSVGAVEEPCNYVGKFPRANLHTHYVQGMSLGEAYFRNAQFTPFQMLLYGDPLTRPFAKIPEVSVFGVPEDPVAGDLTLIPIGSTPNPAAGIDGYDLFVDGKVVDSIGFNQAFNIDTTQFDDGFHEFRIVIYDNTPLRTAASVSHEIEIRNAGLLARITAVTTSGDLSTKYRIDAGAQPTARVEELRLLHGERVIATSPTAPTTFNIYGHMFGAGPVELRTEAIFDNGMRVRSDPAVINVDFTAGTPSGAAPVAYDYTKRVLADSPALIELPANYDDEAVNATFQLVTFPSQAAFHPGTAAPYRILLPMEGASGVDSFSFKVTTPAGTSNTATITVEYTSEDPGIEGDLDGDGCVDLADLGILLASFGIDDGGDINGDGETDLSDLGALLANWQAGC
jgi:hypothetical protein